MWAAFVFLCLGICREAQGLFSTIQVCTNKNCRKGGSRDTFQVLTDLADESAVNVCEVTCLGSCNSGPNIKCGAETNGKMYLGVKTAATVAAVLVITSIMTNLLILSLNFYKTPQIIGD